MKKWFAVFYFVLLSSLIHAAPVVVGKDYTILPKPHSVSAPGKIEILEFFSYDCIHCSKLQPLMSTYQTKLPSDVNFRKVQVMWGKSREGFAKLHATIQALGLEKKLERSIFDVVNNQRINLNNPSILTSWIQKQPGIDSKKFMSVYNSFGANTEVSKYTQLTKDYAIDGTPSIIVNGKYKVNPASPERMLEVTTNLVQKERVGKGAK